MIWRLPHPIRGLLAGVATFVLAASLLGFGVGLGEFAVVVSCAAVVTWLVARRSDTPTAGRTQASQPAQRVRRVSA